jgi:hypothetical protein
MAEVDPEHRGWRRGGSPTIGEFAMALVLVLVVAVVAFIVLGGQTSQILSHASGTV